MPGLGNLEAVYRNREGLNFIGIVLVAPGDDNWHIVQVRLGRIDVFHCDFTRYRQRIRRCLGAVGDLCLAGRNYKCVFIQPHKTSRYRLCCAVDNQFIGMPNQFIAAHSDFKLNRAGKTCQVDILRCYCKGPFTEIQRHGSNCPRLAFDNLARVCVLVLAFH